MADLEIYNPVETGFKSEKCFLCGIDLEKSNQTKEHIFPQWLINHFNLGTKHLNLFFDRKVRYKQITVPCCKTCNSSILAPLERKIRHNFIELKDDEFDLSDEEIAIWAGKIYYGILLYDYLDALQTLNDEEFNQIKDFLCTGDIKVILLLLQSLAKPIIFRSLSSDFPISVFHYKLQVSRHVNNNFDFKTSSLTNCFMIRIGKRGFLISFDGGYQTLYPGYDFYKYSDKILHPLQFNELSAHLMTLSFLKAHFRRFIKYQENENIIVEYYPENFMTWYNLENATETFLDFFSFTLGLEKSEMLIGEDSRLSYLENENGFYKMTLDD